MQYTPLKVLQYLEHGVKIELDRPMKPLNLAPRWITEPRDIDFALKDLAKGGTCRVYIDMADRERKAAGSQKAALRPSFPDHAAFLSRSRVHTVTSWK